MQALAYQNSPSNHHRPPGWVDEELSSHSDKVLDGVERMEIIWDTRPVVSLSPVWRMLRATETRNRFHFGKGLTRATTHLYF